MVFIIKPVSAQLTKDKDLFGKMDPYVICTIGHQKQRTKTHQGGGKKPQWFDTLQFQSNGTFMKVQMYDDDVGKDDFIGQGSVNLNQLMSNPMRTQNQYVDLIFQGKSAGRVLISMEYQGQSMGGNNGGWGNNNGGGWGNNQGSGNNQGGWGNNAPNNGWGNNPPNNGGWGNNGQSNGGWGNNGPNNSGWGSNGPNNGGWGNNNPNNGWGNNGPNNGWGNNNPNNGWGNNGSNNGWGNNGPNNSQNNGWGNNGPNNGWGNNGSNNGWGNGPNRGW